MKPKKNTPGNEKIPRKSRLRENIEAILFAIVLALFIRTFVIQAFKIPSGSMKETLLIGDHILVNKFIYGVKLPFLQKTIIPVKEPDRGDIVVFKFPKDPKKDFIKRVVGITGDQIVIKDKKVYVNGEIEEEKHIIHMDSNIFPAQYSRRDNLESVTVPPDSIFVMGDNRDN
ncbi:MAG TPA: signal peptidase I, partial [Desulfobacteraceae bacterium]|nr:signal peptidase I [Desulfobacteraceae bacterium]